MRVAGIDLGKVRVGLALSDELGMLAHPRPFLDGSNMGALLTALVELAQQEQISRFVVGLPRLLDGREGPPARRARRFAEVLGTRSGKPVELVDEWLSTREASARLREGGLDGRQARQRIDSASAAVLLQAWLDRKRDRS
jgi:putative holliday junction resolvase